MGTVKGTNDNSAMSIGNDFASIFLGIGENGFPTITFGNPEPTACANPKGCGPQRYQGGDFSGRPSEKADGAPAFKRASANTYATAKQNAQIMVVRCVDHACAQARAVRKSGYDWDRPSYPHFDVNGEYVRRG